jgi:hypothetical protein
MSDLKFVLITVSLLTGNMYLFVAIFHSSFCFMCETDKKQISFGSKEDVRDMDI